MILYKLHDLWASIFSSIEKRKMPPTLQAAIRSNKIMDMKIL